MSNVTELRPSAAPPTVFDRREINAIMSVYGRLVAAGLWRDYAIDCGRDSAVFSAFRRSAERPDAQVHKVPSLRHKQGMYALVGEHGGVLRRGHDLTSVLAPLERRLLRLVVA